MTQLAKYIFAGHEVRTNNDPMTPLFIAKDICEALGYEKPRNAIARHVDLEDVIKVSVQTNGGKQDLLAVNESGLYALIFGSKLDSAKKFKRWVTSEVLPSIRKTGTYTVPRKTITVEQQQAIRKAISMRCKNSHTSYKTVYTSLYEEFQIPRYTELLQSDFEKAVTFIDNLDLKVPALRKSGFSVPDGHLLLDPIHVEQLRISVYYYTVIMPDVFNVAHQVLSACRSPYAGRMYEANCCGPIYGLRQLLESNGIDVQTPRLAR